jgi:ABC transporter with metal-binding/Fe-S-binding domain ATP-binding protein
MAKPLGPVMRVGVLFSGGKDSCLAQHIAGQHHEVVCLITVLSKNPESYMFHTPNVHMTSLQAEAMGLPIVTRSTAGVKEEELADLKGTISDAVQLHGIEGVVTGAVGSVYQSTRVQRICDEIDLQCLNPLWQMDQLEVLRRVLDLGFEVIISGVFAMPLDEEWLGRTLDEGMVEELGDLQQRYEINPAGEGGELETTVLDGPTFRRRIQVEQASSSFHRDSGVLTIEDARLVEK